MGFFFQPEKQQPPQRPSGIPRGVCKPGSSYAYLNLREVLATLTRGDNGEEYFQVVISEVFHPHKFWFQLKGDHYDEALQQLMDDLQ